MIIVAELIVSCSLALCLAGYNVEVAENSATWHDALVRCTEIKSILADITDVEMSNTCNRIVSKRPSNRYWVGNFYKLSNRISIEEFEDKPAVAVKCISISCFRHFTIKVRSQNCSLTTNGFVCVKPKINKFSICLYRITRYKLEDTLKEQQSRNVDINPKVKSNNDSITSFTTSSSPKSSLNMSSVVQQPVNKNFHDTTRSISPRTKSSILPAAFKGKVQSEATRLHISSTRANNFKNPSSHVPQKKNILESTTTGLSDPLVKCHSKIGFIIAGVLGAAIVIIVTVFLLVICWLRQKGPFKKKSLYEDIQVNELDNSKYQEIGVDSDQIRRVAVQKVESMQH